MKASRPTADARRRSQAGYTLVELMVATTIGVLVMGALTSVFLTTALSTNVATSRVDAANQLRSFQLTAYDDMTMSSVPQPSGCGSVSSPCTTQAIVLRGSKMANQKSGVAAAYSVTYAWNSASGVVSRQVGGGALRTVATNVTSFSWYLDLSSDHPAIVVNLTVTVRGYNATYSESQSLRFYPRLT